MQKKITFRRMQHSKVMEDYANKQLEKIVTFLEKERPPIYIDLILEPSKIHACHVITLKVKTPHFDMISTYEGSKFYDVLDRVIDVMYADLLKKKKEQKDHEKTQGRRESAKCWFEGMEGTYPKHLTPTEEAEKEEGIEFDDED